MYYKDNPIDIDKLELNSENYNLLSHLKFTMGYIRDNGNLPTGDKAIIDFRDAAVQTKYMQEAIDAIKSGNLPEKVKGISFSDIPEGDTIIFKGISEILDKDSEFESIVITDSSGNDDGLSTLLESLAKHPTIKSLCLRGTKISSKAVPSLANMIENTHSLENIVLPDMSGLKDNDFVILKEAVSKNKTIVNGMAKTIDHTFVPIDRNPPKDRDWTCYKGFDDSKSLIDSGNKVVKALEAKAIDNHEKSHYFADKIYENVDLTPDERHEIGERRNSILKPLLKRSNLEENIVIGLIDSAAKEPEASLEESDVEYFDVKHTGNMVTFDGRTEGIIPNAEQIKDVQWESQIELNSKYTNIEKN